jgi:hypothetical protein
MHHQHIKFVMKDGIVMEAKFLVHPGTVLTTNPRSALLGFIALLVLRLLVHHRPIKIK